MIIWIRNRKGWIGGVFFILAAIFALSFVIGGVGTGNNASLSDIFGNSGGGSASSTTAQPSSISALQKLVKAKPKSADAWSQLADAYASASEPSNEAGAWQHYIALKPADFNGLQRLASAQGLVATNFGNEAQTYEQQGSASSPGNDSTFTGGTLGTLTEDPVSQAEAASQSDEQTKALQQAGKLASKATAWWKKSTTTYGKLVAVPSFSQNDLAASIWLNYGSAAQQANDSKTALTAFQSFLKLAPDDANAPQVRKIVKQLKQSAGATVTTSG